MCLFENRFEGLLFSGAGPALEPALEPPLEPLSMYAVSAVFEIAPGTKNLSQLSLARSLARIS